MVAFHPRARTEVGAGMPGHTLIFTTIEGYGWLNGDGFVDAAPFVELLKRVNANYGGVTDVNMA